MAATRPNILFLMTDQQRFDSIAALGNRDIYTPNLDRLVRRGLSFTNAYTPCPVCLAARYSIRTGCDPLVTRTFTNRISPPLPGQADTIEGRTGPYLARTMSRLGYRTFGIGKFHTWPVFEDVGFDRHLHSEELYGSRAQRRRDSYASFIRKKHPEYDWVEGLMGERTEMYYMPQMSPMPAACTVEAWAADRAVESIRSRDRRPWFGFVSFVGPHPPFAPPIPFNRMYDPDRMPNPVRGDIRVDHMDDYLPWMNHAIWAEDIHDPHARVLRARYYGEISYIDWCIGRILDAVEQRRDAANTLICFFSDHGDHLGDHHAWQKEGFFEASCRVPFLVSWPRRLPKNRRRRELVSLTDLFGIATTAAGAPELRDGADVLGMVQRTAKPRERLFSYHGEPGTRHFKLMVREGDWKYIFLANGGREQLFQLVRDPHELRQRANDCPNIARKMRRAACEELAKSASGRAALRGDDLRAFDFRKRKRKRIYQFDRSRGVTGFPVHPKDALAGDAARRALAVGR